MIRLFTNLTYSKEFRESNFCNFMAEGTPSLPVYEAAHSYISAQLSDPDSPEPSFWNVLPTTLSEACCTSFLRHQRLPALPRDYYLSKLYQFIFEAFRCIYRLEEPSFEVGREVHRLLDQIPDTHLPPSRSPEELAEIFNVVYDNTDGHSLDESMAELEMAVARLVMSGPGVRVRNGRRGRPAILTERKEAAYQAKLAGKTVAEQAALLYGVKHPTPGQVKNAWKILDYYENKRVPSTER